jgi:3-oxoacyl-[acyl-carrier protein] reductase
MGAQWNDGWGFEGKVAVVSGGGGTLGGAIARGFGAAGASVALAYPSSRSRAEEVVVELEGWGARAHSGQLDLTDQDSVDAFVLGVAERYGRPDVLVNAAGRLERLTR